MNLPKIDLPIYKLDLKTSERTIKFRPFVVKEEKLLMMAMESNEFDSIMEAMKQVINNCIIDDDLNIDELPLFELEHLFLNIRARSVGEIVELSYICQNEIDDRKCGAEMLVEVDLLKVDLNTPEINPIMKITESVGIKLKYPTIEVSKVISDNLINGDTDIAIKIIEHCTEFLFDTEQTYKVEDMQPGEFAEFIGNLTQEQFQSIKSFFDNLPTIKFDTVSKCPKCTKEHNIKLEGLLDFFE